MGMKLIDGCGKIGPVSGPACALGLQATGHGGGLGNSTAILRGTLATGTAPLAEH